MAATVIPLTVVAERDARSNLRVTIQAAGGVPCGCVRCPSGLIACGCPPRCPDFDFDAVDGLVANIEMTLEDGEIVRLNIRPEGAS